MTEIKLLKSIPSHKEPRATLVLAHGAGAPMDSEFMDAVSQQLCLGGCEVIRFEFPYMQERRHKGRRRPPDRVPVLLDCWRACLAQVRADLPSERKLLIGGKSLGGRMASLIADEAKVDGLICLGYPFHPTNKPEKLRTGHLEYLQTQTLIVQGTRDPLGNVEDVLSYSLSASIAIHWLADGDHDFKPRIKSGYLHRHHIATAVNSVLHFIDRLEFLKKRNL